MDPQSAPQSSRQIYLLPEDHPWQTAICPIVAVQGQTAVPIGSGFTIASFGIVITPAVVPTAALGRSTQIGCVFGSRKEGARTGVFVPIAQIYSHQYTDFALLQLALPPDAVPLPILPFTMAMPADGARLVAVGYSGFRSPGTFHPDNRVLHDWRLSAYWDAVSGVAESPRKQGPPNKLILFAGRSGFEAGMIGGPVFAVIGQPGAPDPVCGVLGQFPRDGRMVPYGMALSPAMGLHVLFSDGGEPAHRCFYDIATAGHWTSGAGLDRLQLFPFDQRYSVVVELDKASQPPPAAPTPAAWLLSQGLELGYYIAGGVPIVRYTPSLHSAAMPLAMTAAHEKAHMSMMTATEYGGFVCELANVVRRLADLQQQNPSDALAASFQDLGQAMDSLMKASWLTQESGATAIEILHSPAPDPAAMKQNLPATYVFAFEALERVAATLHLPFLPLAEPLRSSVYMGICSAALNTGILDRLSAAPKISATAITEYLSDPVTRPDSRLLKLSEAAQLNPRLLDPAAPALAKALVDLGDALASAAADRDHLTQCYSDAGRNVDRIVQNHIRGLGLFPVSSWIDIPLDTISAARDKIREKMFDDTRVNPKDRVKVTWHDLALENVPEQISFSGLDHSHDALRAKDLAPFGIWIQRVRNLKIPAGGRLVFSAAPIPNPGTEDRWTCYIACLTVNPGTVRFNRLAIEFDAIPEADLLTALRQLEAPTCATVYSHVMPLTSGKLKRVFDSLPVPVFQYAETVSVQNIDTLLAGFTGGQARLIAAGFGPNNVFCVYPQDRRQSRLLWFESGNLTPVYRSMLRNRAIALDESPLDLDREDDMYLALSAWMCTYGAIGAREPRQ